MNILSSVFLSSKIMINLKVITKKIFSKILLQICCFIIYSKRKKKWMGTIPGTLSVYSPHFFTSGTCVFNEQGWWTLTYPNLSPSLVTKLSL